MSKVRVKDYTSILVNLSYKELTLSHFKHCKCNSYILGDMIKKRNKLPEDTVR